MEASSHIAICCSSEKAHRNMLLPSYAVLMMRLLPMLLAVSACGSAAPPAADDVRQQLGWQGAPWGASPATVREVVPVRFGNLEADTDNAGGLFFRMTGTLRDKARTYTASAFFDPEQRLRGAILTPLPEGEGCDEVKNELLSLYGRPLEFRREKDISLETHVWRDGRTLITFMHDIPPAVTSLPDFCPIEYKPATQRDDSRL